MKRLCLVLAGALLLAAATTTRLYLTDGSYHVVREYSVEGDRVKYYSTERGEWEEIPLDLIDMKRTKKEQSDREQDALERAKADDIEEAAERAIREEIARVPVEPGVYWINGKEIVTIPVAESEVVTDKKRSILKTISPIPVFTGKATVELQGGEAKTGIAQGRPEFYIRLTNESRFGIIRLSTLTRKKKDYRVVEKWDIVPITKELIQQREEVDIFRHQVGEGVYKIWPQKPLEVGQYAVIEYIEGKGNTQVWDFAVRPLASH